VQSAALDIAVKNDVGLFSSSRTEMGRLVVRLSELEDITTPTKAWYYGCNYAAVFHLNVLFIGC